MTAYTRHAQTSSANWCKWTDGETKTLRILSRSPTRADRHWVGQRSQDCTGPQCALCNAGVPKSTRWHIQVEGPDGQQTWDMANLTFSALEDVAEMVGTLHNLTVQVKRHGTGRQTRYSIVPTEARPAPTEAPTDFTKLVDEIKRLCALAGMDTKQELKLFLSEVEPDLARAPADKQMRAFYEYIKEETKDTQPVDEPQPEEPADISSYF